MNLFHEAFPILVFEGRLSIESLQRNAPYPAVPYTVKEHKHRELIIGSELKGNKPPFWISVNLQFPDEAGQASVCETIPKRENVSGQSMISYMVYLIMVDMIFG